MKKFFDCSLPSIFILSLLPLALMIIFPTENMQFKLYNVYFFLSLLSCGNFCGYLSYKSATRSFTKWSIVYIGVSVLVLMFNVLVSMFIDIVF